MNCRTKYLIAATGILGLAAALFGTRVSNSIALMLLIRQAAPDPVTLEALIHSHSKPAALLRQLWNTDGIPHRHIAMGYLKSNAGADATLYEKSQDLLAEAAVDVDMNNRELALGLMERMNHPDSPRFIRYFLEDADRDARLLALNKLKRLGPMPYTSWLVEKLDDPDPKVRAQTASLLRNITGNDFGVRMAYSVPKRDGDGPNVVPADNLAKLNEGIQKWKAWWPEHAHEFEPLPTPPNPKLNSSGLPAPNFELPDLEGEMSRLSQFRGKCVLLNFWTTWCTTCVMEMPDLVELQRTNLDRLVIVGISLDGSDEHGHSHASVVDLEIASEEGIGAVDGLSDHFEAHEHYDHGRNHQHETLPDQELKDIKAKIRRVIKKRKLNYLILMNPSGNIGSRFNGQELPTNVLIDPDGKIRRRFIGTRPVSTWEAMLDQVAPRI